MLKVKGVIFDLDGTLIDSLETYTKALNRGIAKYNLGPISKEELAPFINRGLGFKAIVSGLYPSLSKETVAECNKKTIKAYRELEEEGVPLKPGAEEVLPQLKEMGLRLGIVTGRVTSGEDKWLELRHLNIAQHIEVMVTGAEAPRKPAPDGLIKCVQELGLSPEECVFVGDSQTDIITGKAAGMMNIATPSGVAKEELLTQEGAEVLLNSLSELPARIRELLK